MRQYITLAGLLEKAAEALREADELLSKGVVADKRGVKDLKGYSRLGVRVRKALTRRGIVSVSHLCDASASYLLETKNFGVTALQEVRKFLIQNHLCLRGEHNANSQKANSEETSEGE